MQFKHEKFEPDQKSEQGKITIGDSWSDSNIAPVESITWRVGDSNALAAFNRFGRSITSLDVEVIEPGHLDFIATTCGQNLRHLILWIYSKDYIVLNEVTKMRLKLLFSHLHSFVLYCQKCFDMRTFEELLSCCTDLNLLSINCMKRVDLNWNQLNIHVPSLKELNFYLNVSMNDEGLERLLTSNPNVKKLYLDECSGLSPKTFEVIARCLPGLEELSLGYLLQKAGAVDLWHLSELKQLKSLTIILGPALSLMHVMSENNIPVESLMLWCVDVTDTLVEKIAKMKQIKKLTVCSNDYVTSNIKDSHLELIAKNLPSLTEFRLSHSNEVSLGALKHFVYHAKVLEVLSLADLKNITTSDKGDLLHSIGRRSNLTIEID